MFRLPCSAPKGISILPHTDSATIPALLLFFSGDNIHNFLAGGFCFLGGFA
jgi:hypothetical protein